MPRRPFVAAIAFGMIAAAPALGSAATFAYDFRVTDFLDSNGFPPPVVTAFTGQVVIDMDLTSLVGEFGFVSSITPFQNDVGFTFDETNTTFSKITQTAVPSPVFRIAVGGLGQAAAPSASTADSGVGASDDFRFQFEIDETGAVLQTLTGDNFSGYANSSPPSAYVANTVEVTNVAVSPVGPVTPVPAPPAALFLLSALGALAFVRRRKTG